MAVRGLPLHLIAGLAMAFGLACPPALAATPRDSLRELARAEALRHGLDVGLVLAVIRTESGFDARALSARGAMGLMQLMPDTARRFGVHDPWDPIENLRGGCAYLRWLIDRYDGDLRLVLAAYNAGEGAVDDYGGVPPYPETQAYVAALAPAPVPARRTTPAPRPVIAWQSERPVGPTAGGLFDRPSVSGSWAAGDR